MYQIQQSKINKIDRSITITIDDNYKERLSFLPQKAPFGYLVIGENLNRILGRCSLCENELWIFFEEKDVCYHADKIFGMVLEGIIEFLSIDIVNINNKKILIVNLYQISVNPTKEK